MNKIRRAAVIVGLGAWALGSATLLGVGINGLVNEPKMTATAVTTPVAAVVSAPVETPVLVLAATPTTEPKPASDNFTCGSGCVRASFTVVNPQ